MNLGVKARFRCLVGSENDSSSKTVRIKMRPEETIRDLKKQVADLTGEEWDCLQLKKW